MEIQNNVYRQVENLFRLQDELNSAISGKNWRAKSHDYLLAASVECAEAFEHLGTYKWWKKQEPNLIQFKLELVDILFFLISEAMANTDCKPSDIAEIINYWEMYSYPVELTTQVALKQLMYSLAAGEMEMSIDNLFHLCSDLDIEFQEIYNLYIGKAVLNNFRQEHGYKSGTYKKTWKGKEDNEVLVEISNRIRSNNLENTRKCIKQELEVEYAKI